MDLSIRRLLVILSVIITCLSGAYAQQIQLQKQSPDPYGSPRPTPGETNVPIGTSLYFALEFKDKTATDAFLPDSLAVQLRAEDGNTVDILSPGQKFKNGYSGKITDSDPQSPIVYIDHKGDLKPSTKYYVSVTARSRDGVILGGKDGQWQFTTEDKAAVNPVSFQIDLSSSPVRWHGGFFTGFCKTTFCSSAANRIPSYELMDSIRKQYPKSWSLVRDLWASGTEYTAGDNPLDWGLPNAVRERETRRITAMEKRDDGILLRVEAFFGHEQYGIDSNRPLAGDYHPGDEILIADGRSDARAKVVAIADDSGSSRALLVTPFKYPTDGWNIDYFKPLPKKEDPNSPGLFPNGGCYVRKFKPAGTPHYYWGRIDKEWDIQHRQFGRRLVVNFCDAPGDLAVDGRSWTYPKDYAEYHDVAYAHATHLIDRYGKACLNFYWSVYNEADLTGIYWRSSDGNDLQKFYDHTVDAVCRAFEDRGYDSNSVIVGGFEMAAPFGSHVGFPVVEQFLAHCSPKATYAGAMPQNAVIADKRLDGKRSRRVENLCRSTGGKGSPLNFFSIHTYTSAPTAAEKIIAIKKLALEIDAEYYANLWACSFESCPNWMPSPDAAFAESNMGNGYFTSWCTDVVQRQLAQAARDSRYAYGESVLSIWPFPNGNFEVNLDNETRAIAVDENGDGRKDRNVVVAEPVLNFLGLMSGMGDNYLVLPERKIGGSVISGFAAKKTDAINVLVYSHNWLDTQSRSKKVFEVTLDINDIPWKKVHVKEYRFDKDNNSYYRMAIELRDRPVQKTKSSPLDPNEINRIIAVLRGSDPNAQVAQINKLAAQLDVPDEINNEIKNLYRRTKNEKIRGSINSLGIGFLMPQKACYSPRDAAKVKELSMLHITKESNHKVSADGKLRLPVTIAANGANFIVIEPAAK